MSPSSSLDTCATDPSSLALLAIHLNTIGASLVVEKEFKLSIRILRQAIEALKGQCKHTLEGIAIDLREVFHTRNEAAFEAAIEIFSATKICGRHDDIRTSNDFLIYSSPVDLPLTSPSDVEGLTLEEISAIILFNLGLANHLDGSTEHAIELYKMAESLSSKSTISTTMFSAWRKIRTTEAIINNMGQIYLEWGEYQLGKEYFDVLGSICSHQQEWPHGMEEQDGHSRGLFMFNSLVVKSMNAASAA